MSGLLSLAPSQEGCCPELEHLAAFIDGRLGADERLAVAEHLSRCDVCYDTFAETALFRRESHRHPARRGRYLRLLWLALLLAGFTLAALLL